MALLIFGTRGQVGQELVDLCASRSINVRLVPRSECDISSADQVGRVVRESAPTAIINAAAYTKVDLAETEVQAVEAVNRDGAGHIAKEAAALGVPVLHLSTDYVFDGSKMQPYVETDPVAPLGAYGRSKEAGERVVRLANHRHVIIRTSWLYGIYGHNFLKTMLHLAQTRNSWSVVDDQIGTPTSTRDLAEALLAVVEKAKHDSGQWGTYHFSGTGAVTWFEFAREIVKTQALYSGKCPNVLAVPSSEYPTVARRPSNSRLNSDLFMSAFGYQARHWRERTHSIIDHLMTRTLD